MDRRTFLKASLILCATPALVRATSLEFVPRLPPKTYRYVHYRAANGVVVSIFEIPEDGDMRLTYAHTKVVNLASPHLRQTAHKGWPKEIQYISRAPR